MDLLTIVQTLHLEAKLPGSAPSAVTGLTGRAADLLRWSIEAWNDIQRERDGKWKWLRADFTVDTAADDASYAYSDCTDVASAAAISRFRAWDLDRRDPPHIYLVSDGAETEHRLLIDDWRDFRYLYLRGTHTSAEPSSISVDVDDNLWLGPTPDGIYRVSGSYWKSNQILADSDDEPEMPSNYHMLVVYRAITKYAYNVVGHEILARAKAEGTPLFDALVMNQAYSRFSISTAGCLA